MVKKVKKQFFTYDFKRDFMVLLKFLIVFKGTPDKINHQALIISIFFDASFLPKWEFTTGAILRQY